MFYRFTRPYRRPLGIILLIFFNSISTNLQIIHGCRLQILDINIIRIFLLNYNFFGIFHFRVCRIAYLIPTRLNCLLFPDYLNYAIAGFFNGYQITKIRRLRNDLELFLYRTCIFPFTRNAHSISFNFFTST